MDVIKITDSPFMNLLVDSVVFAQMAKDIVGRENFPKASRSSRASILNATLSVECAANCCIAHLKSGGGLRDDIDKMPYISKFDIYLGLNFNGAFLDRGRHEVAKVQELKSIRDKLVHPRRKTADIKIIEPNLFKGDFGKWDKLGIDRLEKSWNYEDAVSVLKAISEFYNYFFFELCKYNHHQTCSILMNNFVTDPPTNHIETEFNLKDADLHRAIEDWNLNFDFIGIN